MRVPNWEAILWCLSRTGTRGRWGGPGLWCAIALVACGGMNRIWADTILSEGPPIHDATKIPTWLERGFDEAVPRDRARILPEAPLETIKEAPSFIREGKLTLHLRNYYLTRDDFDGNDIETWAQGGWLGFVSGRAGDVLSFGVTGYGSYKLYGPEERDGASLLKPGQHDISVLGELYLQADYARHRVKLGRQEYDFPFLNRQDIRMIPNTFEAYHIGAPAEGNPNVQYGVSYVDKIKKKNADSFIPMSEAAGAPDGVKRGAIAGGVRYNPGDVVSLELFDVYTPDIHNILYAEAVSKLETEAGIGIKLSGQFIHQESVGDDLLERAAANTHALGGKVETSYRKAVLTLALTGNSSAEDLVSPYGTYAGYNSIIINDYLRAGEYGFRAGLSYDLAEIGLKGVSAFGNYVWGFNAVDPTTGLDIPNQDELDLTLEYRRIEDGWLNGLGFRLRAALIEEEGGRSLEDYRVIVNYTL